MPAVYTFLSAGHCFDHDGLFIVGILSPLFHSFAYIEFSDRDSVHSAIGLHETLFRGRVLKVRSITLHVSL